jgi:effector-binding domain-containing protein
VSETGRIRYGRLPACTAATIIHHGSYATLGTTRAALMRWIRSAGLRPSGDERILYLQFGAEPELDLPRGYLVERETEFVTELQVPLA